MIREVWGDGGHVIGMSVNIQSKCNVFLESNLLNPAPFEARDIAEVLGLVRMDARIE